MGATDPIALFLPQGCSRTMTSRDLVLQTLNQSPVPRVPRDIWYSPDAQEQRADEVRELSLRFPSDIVWVQAKPAGGRRSGSRAGTDSVPDAWGCVWGPGPRGSFVEPSPPPLADAKKAAEFRPPRDLLDEKRFDHLPALIERETCFVLAQSEVRPFERLRALRGSKSVLGGMAKEKRSSTSPLRNLLTMIHEAACREIELWSCLPVDGVVFCDVWGGSERLLVEPQVWRELFKPLYEEYCRILHANDKFAFFLTGGNVYDIVNDLVKIGVDAVNAEWGCSSFPRLVKRFAGQITFWGGLDRPEILQTGSPAEVRQAVRRLLHPYDDPRHAPSFRDTGEAHPNKPAARTAIEDVRPFSIIAQCCFDAATPTASLVAFCEQWHSPLPPPLPPSRS